MPNIILQIQNNGLQLQNIGNKLQNYGMMNQNMNINFQNQNNHINDLNINNQVNVKKKNIFFDTNDENRMTLVIPYGTTMEKVLEKYLQKTLKFVNNQI